MKKIVNYKLVAILLLIVACQSKRVGFEIKGEIGGDGEGKKVYLATFYDMPPVILDSTTIANGTFQFEGRVEYPQRYKIMIDNNPKGEQGSDKGFVESFFYIENAPITYAAHIDSMPSRYYQPDRKVVKPVVKGSLSEELYQEYTREVRDISVKYDSLFQEYINRYHKPTMENVFNTKVGIELAKQMKEVDKQKKRNAFSFIKKYPESIVSLDIAREFVENIYIEVTEKEIDTLLSLLKPVWKETQPMKVVDSLANLAKFIALGNNYPDIFVMNQNDEKVLLSSIIKPGEYTMLEFWASWCAPCRGEIPHLKNVYNEYKNRKFNIVSVSIDENKSDWEKALKEEKMPWIQMYDSAGFDSDIMKKYRVFGVPASFIINPQGKIVEVNTRGAFLDLFLEEKKL